MESLIWGFQLGPVDWSFSSRLHDVEPQIGGPVILRRYLGTLILGFQRGALI